MDHGVDSDFFVTGFGGGFHDRGNVTMLGFAVAVDDDGSITVLGHGLQYRSEFLLNVIGFQEVKADFYRTVFQDIDHQTFRRQGLDRNAAVDFRQSDCGVELFAVEAGGDDKEDDQQKDNIDHARQRCCRDAVIVLW